jgi:hypothetical protein
MESRAIQSNPVDKGVGMKSRSPMLTLAMPQVYWRIFGGLRLDFAVHVRRWRAMHGQWQKRSFCEHAIDGHERQFVI